MEILDTLKGSYIKDLLKQGKRLDSRQFLEFRDIKIKQGLISNAEGSAQVDLGDTRVLVGVKLMPEDPMPDTEGQGNIIANAELLQLARGSYESGPPNPEAIELARVVDRGIRAGNCIDLKSLVLEDNKVWSIFIDIYVLNYGGNLFDASSMAAMTALMNTKIPKYEAGKAVREERTKSLKIDNIVTSTTFGKIDSSILLDMNMNEESIADTRLTVATDGEVLRAMQKGLSGSFMISEIEGILENSFEQHKKLKSAMEKAK